jgi:phosphate acetyltransferase
MIYSMPLPESAVEFLEQQRERVRNLEPRRRIVFPEGNDPRVIEAAARLAQERLVHPILVGAAPAAVPAGVEYADPETSRSVEKYAGLYHERRRSRGVTQMEAAQAARRPLNFAALMVGAGDADGFVGGASNSTAETMRAAIHGIGTPPSVRTVSGIMILCVRYREFGHNGLLAMADPAVVIEPSAVQLADITLASAATVRAMFGVEPVIAMLSFSTKGSARHKAIDRIVEAHRIVKARHPELHVDAELQADAALVPAVGRSKAPGSTVAGQANTLVFPDLNAANIGAKLVERLGGAAAFGPFFQGLSKPANDLSRGCSAGDIYAVALGTALQSGDARRAAA